jgi:hypothetical protein
VLQPNRCAGLGVGHGWRWSAVGEFEWTAAGFNRADSWLLAARGKESVLQSNRCAAIRTAGGSRLVASAVFERNSVRWRIRLRLIGWQICVILRTSCVLGALASKHLLAAPESGAPRRGGASLLALAPKARGPVRASVDRDLVQLLKGDPAVAKGVVLD